VQLCASAVVPGTEVTTADGVGTGVTAAGKPEVQPAAAIVAMQTKKRAITFAFIRLRIGSGNIKPGAGVHCRLYQDLTDNTFLYERRGKD
jgi:hypothetical protein